EFYDTHAHNIPQPVLVGDLDGDDELEVVLVEEDGSGSLTVKFIEPTTGDLIHIDSGMSPLSNMALVNNNHGHEMDVFYVRASDGWLEGKNGDGTDKDGYPQDLGLGAGPYYISGGTILSETIEWVVVAAGRDVNVMNWDGDQWEGWPWTAPLVAGQINGRVAVGDVDFDGLGELVVPFTNRVAVLDAYGQVISQFGDGEAAAGSPSLADFDRDGDLEIVIPRADGTIHVVHHDGTPLTANWPYDTGAVGMPSQVALADIAGNDRRDLIFTDASHTVHVMTPAGILVQQWDLGVDPASPVVEPVVAQVGLGEPAVIVGGPDGRLRVHTLDGSQEGWPRDLPESILTAVTVADIDADGMVEMMVPTSENLWVLDMGVANDDSLSLWPMSGADSRRSGSVAADPAAVSATPPMPASPLALHGTVPNPFNPATSIRFSLPESAPNVSLRVYDVAGRLVKTLHRGALPEGDHQVVWRGDDSEGRTVASGVYYCRLEAAGHVRTRSMVLAR
nr:FG-GAP-like repeat-containing protein [Candidatus Krumholzibacteria bacterium]